MGEVYRATDTSLKRQVAVKVLPPTLATDPERLARFQREAEILAALNHPNIAHIHGLEKSEGTIALVMELVEGPTLADRIARGAIPLADALPIAKQIAEALEAAHEQGIVHRDLKPANIKVRADGAVKVLDFGLAKAMDPAGGSGSAKAMNSPTISMHATQAGIILGTAAYMSPEQARGSIVDKRADLWAFGVVLYEMLAGVQLFEGPTVSDTLAAVLRADPDWIRLPADTPVAIRRVLRRCLEKDPKRRARDIGDVRLEIDEALNAPIAERSAAAVTALAVPARLPRAWVGAALALGLTIGAAAAWGAAARTRPTPAAGTFQPLTFRRGTITAARFSPNGETIVYSAGWEGREQELYSTRVGAIGERPLGIQGELLAISKSEEMALLLNVRVLSNWMQAGTLARAPLGGGAPREILRDIGGADWSPDGQQLVITRFLPAERHWRLEYPVGTVIHETDTWIESPRLSRDGSKILLLEHPISGDNRGKVVLFTLKGEKTVITPEYSTIGGTAWSPSGNEAWFSASDGMRRNFLAVRPGGPVRRIAPAPASIVVEDVRSDGRTLLQTLSFKARMLVKTPTDSDERDLSWFDFPTPRDMSPDGTTLLFDEQGEGGGPNYSVFVRRTDGAPAVRIGDGAASRLSPDLQTALTHAPSDPPNALTIMPIGPGEARKMVLPLQAGGSRWFPDGKRLVFIGNEPARPRRSYEYTIESGKARPLTPEGTTGTLVSPDGRLLIASTTEGRRILWAIDGGEPREISGVLPQDAIAAWATDGRSLWVSGPTTARRRDIARLDLVTGRRERLLTFGPSDPAGVRATVGVPFVSADGRTYAYSYSHVLSDLFVGDGLQPGPAR
jgi:Tol biopolymer transport system component